MISPTILIRPKQFINLGKVFWPSIDSGRIYNAENNFLQNCNIGCGTFLRYVQEDCDAINMIAECIREHVTGHSLRTTVLSHLLEAGNKKQAITTKMGHQNPNFVLASVNNDGTLSSYIRKRRAALFRQKNIKGDLMLNQPKLDRLHSQLQNACVQCMTDSMNLSSSSIRLITNPMCMKHASMNAY